MYDIQRLIIQDQKENMTLSSENNIEVTTVEVKQIKDTTEQKQKHSTHIYHQSKSLKQI